VAGSTLRVVAPGAAEASCDAGEVLISAMCTGTFSGYPLRATATGASCVDPGGQAQVTIVCMPQQ
jgi:hypothetical protein